MPKRSKPFSITGTATIAILIVVGYFLVTNQMILRWDGQYQGMIAEATENPFDVKIFGHSGDGRAISGYIIGDGPDTLLLFGALHGNEPGTAETMNQLVAEVRDNPHLLASSKKLIIIPISNPEGYYERTDKLNNNGVNLNLNFPTEDWDYYGPGGTYSGDEPFSEPESRVIRDIVWEYKPYAMISFHAKGGLISPEKYEISKEWSRWYAEESGYEYFEEWDFFGTATRWFTETTGQPSITVELTDYVNSDWEINKPALLKIIGQDSTSLPD